LSVRGSWRVIGRGERDGIDVAAQVEEVSLGLLRLRRLHGLLVALVACAHLAGASERQLGEHAVQPLLARRGIEHGSILACVTITRLPIEFVGHETAKRREGVGIRVRTAAVLVSSARGSLGEDTLVWRHCVLLRMRLLRLVLLLHVLQLHLLHRIKARWHRARREGAGRRQVAAEHTVRVGTVGTQQEWGVCRFGIGEAGAQTRGGGLRLGRARVRCGWRR